MGIVYRARYVVDNREFALKMLPADVTDKTALARFEREMEVLKNLRHAHIVRSFGGSCEDKRRFYAMELVDGGTLEDVLRKKGRISWESVIRYAIQMCSALEFSHGQGVIHRDVKPSNFLVMKNGQLKLSDFGLASVAAARKITTPGKTAGTLLYMAPEQIQGKELSPRTDLYALGCVLFELLAGHPPFRGDSPAATMHLHCKKEAPRVTQFCMDCPIGFDRLIDQMLAKNPDDRPESAAAVAQELRSVADNVRQATIRLGLNGQISAQPTPTPQRAPLEEPPRSQLPATPTWIAITLGLLCLYQFFANRSLQQQNLAIAKWEHTWIVAASDIDPNVRREAARALGQMGSHSSDGVKSLGAALDDPDVEVRKAACYALGDAGKAAMSFSPAILKLGKTDPNIGVRDAAAAAFLRVVNAKDDPQSFISLGAVLATLLILGTIAAGVYWHSLQTPEPVRRKVRIKYRLAPNRPGT